MRFRYLLVLLCVWVLSCKKENNISNNNNVTNPNDPLTGVLDSVRIYSSDSANFNETGSAGAMRFSYDNQKRITNMEVQQRYYSFLYTGNSQNPDMMVDSNYNSNTNLAYIYKYLFFYDGNGKKIKDTIIDYYTRDINNIETHSSVTIKARHFNHQANYVAMKINNNSYYDDTTYLNNDNDIPNYTWFSSGKEKNTISGYYPDENPFNNLNIQPSFLNVTTFFWNFSFYPLNFDLLHPKHIFKTIIGSNDLIYRYSSDEIVYINSYYNKDVSNRVNEMVLSTYYFKESNYFLYSKSYLNLKFYYHP